MWEEFCVRKSRPLVASKFLAAERVWDAVEAAGENGLTAQQIMEQTGLTHSQFENGKAHIRACVAQDMGQSFFYDGNVYVATTEGGRCALGLVIRLNAVDVQLARTFECGSPKIVEAWTMRIMCHAGEAKAVRPGVP